MSSLSWSENREKSQSVPDSVVRERLRNINDVLAKLSKDEDLQDDFKLPQVKVALDHWTGKNRLPPDEAEELSENRRVVYVLQRLQLLQSVCRASQVAVPFDHFIKGCSKLSDEAIIQTFGPLISNNDNFTNKKAGGGEGQSPGTKNEKIRSDLLTTSTKAVPTLSEYVKAFETSDSDVPPTTTELLFALGAKYFTAVMGSILALLSIIVFLVINSSK